MDINNFHRELSYRDIEYNYDGDNTIVTLNTRTYLRITSLPPKVIFRGNGNLTFSYEFPELEPSTIFEHIGDVNFESNFIQIKSNYKGFKFKGNLYPEMPSFKKLTPVFQVSDDFRAFLNKAYNYKGAINKISNIISNCIGKIQFDINFSYITPVNNTDVGFVDNSKIVKLYTKYKNDTKTNMSLQYPDHKFNQELYKESEKNTVKIGRVVKKLLSSHSDVTDSDIEQFVNFYKAEFSEKYICEIVKGEDIRKYYSREWQDTSTGTILYNSCYNYTTKEDLHPHNNLNLWKQLEFYVQNPNISLIVLKDINDKNGKIKARALLWHGNNNVNFIEYIYCTDESQRYFYRKLAIKNNWLCYESGDDYHSIEIAVPEHLKELEVIPQYLDYLRYERDENLIVSQYRKSK